MNAKIIDIYETTNQELKRSGIITTNEYIKLFHLYIEYNDGIIQSLYFGFAKGWYMPFIEGETLDHYDYDLHRRIEKFAFEYHDLLMNDVNIKEVIKMDKENILGFNQVKPKIKTFSRLKSMLKNI